MRRLSAAALAALAAGCAPAVAANWQPLTTPTAGDPTVQPGLARTSDGVLHVIWPRPNADPTFADLVHVAVPAGGPAGPVTPNVVLAHWTTLSTPDLAVTPAGLLASVGGDQGGGVNTTLSTATSADAGATWTADVSKLNAGHPADEPALTTTSDGTPFFAFGSMFVHRGLARDGSSSDFQSALGAPSPACCGYDPDITADAAGAAVWLQWYSSAAGANGVWAARVDPATGAPAGPPVRMPGSVVTYQGKPMSTEPFGRTAVAARAGSADVFGVSAGGYPTRNKALVWRLGSDGSTLLSRRFGRRDPIRAMTVAAAPGGRMWALWSAGSFDGLRIHARRSNPAGTRWGADQALTAPKGAADAQTLDASAAGGVLDVVGRFSFLEASRQGTPYAVRILPALTLVVSSDPASGGRARLTFSVSDAGSPVSGVRVHVNPGRGADVTSAPTNGRGRARVTVGTGGRVSVRTVSTAYATAKAVISPK